MIDGIDAAACVLARHHLRRGVFPGILGVAVSGTLFSAWLARQLDPAPPGVITASEPVIPSGPREPDVRKGF